MRSDIFRRLRRLVLAALALVFLAAVVLGIAANNLTHIVRWSVRRAFPSAKIEIENARYGPPDRLVVKNFVLSDAGNELVRLDSGSLVFSFDGLWRRQLREVRLVNPVINVTPGAFPSTPAGGKPSGRWTIQRLVCDYGEIFYSGFGDHSPSLHMKFALDWRDLDAPLTATLWDLRAFAGGYEAPFLVLDLVTLDATLGGLTERREVDRIKISGGRLDVGPALRHVISGPPAADNSKNPAAAWKIGDFSLARVDVRLNEPGVSDMAFQLNTTLRDLTLTQAAGALSKDRQVVEITDLEIPSPLDPATKVLTLRNIFLRFTLSGLLRHEIEEVEILHPTIHVGQDFFSYMEDAQKRFGGPADEKSPGWKIHTLDVRLGRLVVGGGGRAQYGLPLNFHTSAREISLDDLASLQIQAALEIPARDYAFETYQIEVSTSAGDLRLAYPPEKGEKNLVGKIFLDRVLWRQYLATDAWLAVTFDRGGINGDFGGRAYGGYISGGFSFFFGADSPWIGWASGDEVDLRRLTDVISPQNFSMNGPLDFRVQGNAFGRGIERIKGDFRAPRPGRMKIGKLDALLAQIPDTWSNLKQSGTRVALEALRDFDYTKAGGDLWFVRDQGILDLKLQGPLGSRTFEIVLHADESQEGKWKEKK